MSTSPDIRHAEIARVLEEHRRAYEALRWLSHISFARPQVLTQQTAATLQNAEACARWVGENVAMFPARVRPEPESVEVFARLFASFFQTSFRIERRGAGADSHLRIERDRDEAAGRDRLSARKTPRGLKRKRKDESQHLKFRAITLLGDETSPGFWDAARELLNDVDVRDDLNLWTWACELVHRSRGEAHGPAVHLLWRQIPHESRENISADSVWDARNRTAAAMERCMRRVQRA
jgi:hypothetical protein